MIDWSLSLGTRYALGVLIGIAGAWASTWAAPLVRDTLFLVPAATTVVGLLVAGGFGPAMVASLIAWLATAWFVLEPVGSLAVASPDQRTKFVLAITWFVISCWMDHGARRGRARAADRERELRESEGRNRELLARASDERDLLDAILATTDAAVSAIELPSRRLLFANQQFADLWGTTRDQLLRDGALSLEMEFATPDGVPYPSGNRPSDLIAERGELIRDRRMLIRVHGGAWRLYSVSGTPLRNADGTITSVVFSTIDITERTATESALTASEERLRRLTDAVPGCVYQFKQTRHGERAFTFVSGGVRELLNLAPHAPLPTFDETFAAVVPGDQERLSQSIEASARALTRWTEEFQAELKDGTRKWIRGSSVPDPPGEDGSITWHGLLLDITDRKRLEDDLLQVQKMESVGRLAGGVAHDFNNILTAIRGNVDLLLEAVDDDNPHAPELRDIRDAAERATTLTRQLLAFSRKQAMQARPIVLGSLVRDMEKMLRRVIGEDIVLLTQPGDDVGTVRADPGQLEQVLMNLAVNARDAMPEGGLLTIETRAVTLDHAAAAGLGIGPGDYVSLVVRDTGHGMDEDTRARIFDPFFTTKPAGKGTGLGLAMVYGIVRQSGGAITVETAPERGATFRLYFPRTARPAERSTIRSTPPSVDAASIPVGATVLLVEDDTAVRTLTHRMLTEAGFIVRQASDAYEALSLAGPACEGLAAVITDVIMPGLGGRDLVRELRSRRPDLRVLFISGYLDIDVGRLELGSRTRLLMKPFARDALLRQLAALIDRETVNA